MRIWSNKCISTNQLTNRAILDSRHQPRLRLPIRLRLRKLALAKGQAVENKEGPDGLSAITGNLNTSFFL
ncbi:unnamed protein product [Boreogadus saida]